MSSERDTRGRDLVVRDLQVMMMMKVRKVIGDGCVMCGLLDYDVSPSPFPLDFV